MSHPTLWVSHYRMMDCCHECRGVRQKRRRQWLLQSVARISSKEANAETSLLGLLCSKELAHLGLTPERGWNSPPPPFPFPYFIFSSSSWPCWELWSSVTDKSIFKNVMYSKMGIMWGPGNACRICLLPTDRHGEANISCLHELINRESKQKKTQHYFVAWLSFR